MKITRDGKTFMVEVDHDAQAEVVDALLRTIALSVDAPTLHGRDSTQRSPVAGLTVSLNLQPAELRPIPDHEFRRS